MESVQKQLEELGLTPNEVRIYLASLEVGAATAQQLAAKAAVVRPTAYVAIGGLKKRGLMSAHTRGKKEYVQAERPGNLLRLIEGEKKKLAERESKLKSLLPGLESLIAMAKEKPEVNYYEGLEGLEVMRKTLLESKPKELLVIGNKPQGLGTEYQEAHQLHGYRLKKLAVRMRVIGINDEKKRLEVSRAYFGTKQGGKNLYEYRVLKSTLVSNGEISIFGEYLALIAYTDHPYGFLIRSIDLAATAKTIFEQLWASLK